MTTTTVKAGLRVAIFGGMLGLLPAVARADSASYPTRTATSRDLPDHAEAEARGAGNSSSSSATRGGGNSSAGRTSAAPDHTTLQAREPGSLDRTNGTTSMVPDHESAERRGTTSDR
jgi:hypothetical protein